MKYSPPIGKLNFISKKMKFQGYEMLSFDKIILLLPENFIFL